MIFDTETIGLPKRTSWQQYPDTRDLRSYNTSRIVQISWIVAGVRRSRTTRVEDFIIKAKDFTVDATHIHGISQEKSMREGWDFCHVMKYFYEDLKKVRQVIGHNVQFDIHVLTSELYRHGLFDIIMELEKKNITCTMQLCTCKEKQEKPPRQFELYEVLFKKPMQNAHDSRWDVLNLYEIVRSLARRRMLTI